MVCKVIFSNINTVLENITMIITYSYKRLLVKIRRFLDEYDFSIFYVLLAVGFWVLVQGLLNLVNP